MRVPFIDLGRSIKPIREAILKDWERCLDTCEFVGGPTVGKLEKKLEENLDVKNFITCANGTDALVIGLQALGVKPGMRVAVPNMTFWAPYEAVVQIGGEPILVDIDENDLQMCFEEFREAHHRFQFNAAILVHLFGWTSGRLREFRTFCQGHGIRLVEDGAQSFGVESEGESIYSQARLATVSFYPAKVLGASGDAGGVSTNDPKVAEMVRTLCNHGRAGHYTYDYVGWNSRLSGLHASFLYRMLEQIDELIKSRRQGLRFYEEFFAKHDDLVQVYRAPAGVKDNGYLSMLAPRHKSGDEVLAAMNAKGVSCGRTYPQTLDIQPPARNTIKTSDLKRSHKLSKTVVNLPLFAGITLEECQYAAESLLAVLKN